MNVNQTHSDLAEYAINCLTKGTPRTYGILHSPQRGLAFSMQGALLPIVELWISFKGKFWDHKTFSGKIVMQQDAYGSPGWVVLMDEKWNYICSTNEGSVDFCCIVIMYSSKCKLHGTGAQAQHSAPLCFKMQMFGNDSSAALIQDSGLYGLWRMDGMGMQMQSLSTTVDFQPKQCEETGAARPNVRYNYEDR